MVGLTYMANHMVVGIPFAIVVFLLLLAVGYATAGGFTRRNLMIAFIGTSVWYALGLVP
jgi:hypothetical protein